LNNKTVTNQFESHVFDNVSLAAFQPYIDLETLRIIQRIPVQELDHMQRVGRLANILSALALEKPRYNNDVKQLKTVGSLAFFHDIGKAWVPAKILLKTGMLSSEEFDQIKLHPIYAKKHIENRPRLFDDGLFLRQLIFDAAVFHHERWDGNGYPYGLKKEGIPLIARLTSICDAYDAITNQRPYRLARTHAEACKEIEKNAGKQFDPYLTDVFLEFEKKFE